MSDRDKNPWGHIDTAGDVCRVNLEQTELVGPRVSRVRRLEELRGDYSRCRASKEACGMKARSSLQGHPWRKVRRVSR